MDDISAVRSLDCDTGIIILSVIASFYSVVSLVLLGCIVWCTCCSGKRKFQVRPLSPKSGYRSPKTSVSYPVNDQHEMTSLPSLKESDLLDDNNVTVTSVVYKNSPFISREEPANMTKRSLVETYPTWRGDNDSPLLHKQMAWSSPQTKESLDSTTTDSGKGSLSVNDGASRSNDHSCHGDDSPSSNSNSDSVFVNSQVGANLSEEDEVRDHIKEIQDLSESPSNLNERKKEAMIGRRRKRRTDSTKPLIGNSESSENSPHKTPPSSESSTPPTPIVVLTKHAGSRKRRSRTDSVKHLVEYMDGTRSLPRMTHLPPLVDSPTQINISPHHLPPIGRTVNPPQEADSCTNKNVPSSLERPRPKGRSSVSPTQADSQLSRLSLNLADDMGLDDRFKTML